MNKLTTYGHIFAGEKYNSQYLITKGSWNQTFSKTFSEIVHAERQLHTEIDYYCI